MKLVKKYIEKDRSGKVVLIPEEDEDMWHAYNLLCKGDTLKASTVRRVVSETATGSTEKSSVRLNLTIRITDVFFDTQAAILRVNGQNVEENDVVKMGGFHTLDLELNRPFTLIKNEWDSVALDRISEACDVSKRAEIAAVVCEEGLANICLVTNNMTLVRQRVEVNVPRKRRGTTTDHDKGLIRFYEAVYQGILKYVDFNVVKLLIIASPGFVKDGLFKYCLDQSLRSNKTFMDHKSKMVLLHCSSGQKHALNDILSDPGLESQLSQTKYAQEIKILEKFYRLLGDEPARAFYGYNHVSAAASKGAIDSLMLTDALFRSHEVSERKKYIRLMDTVKKYGGKTYIFSTMHASGEQLNLMTGIAAILHFPLPDLEEEAELEAEQKKVRELGALAPREFDMDVQEDQKISLGE